MCQRGFMVALNSSHLPVAGRENTQVQQASPSWYYSWGTSTWSVTFQNKSFSWTETKQCDESNFHFSIVKYATGKKGPRVGFLSEPFGTEFNCFNQDKRKKKKTHLFQECFLWDSSSTDHRYKHNSVHPSFTGEKNTFCDKPGEASTHRYVCSELLFHTTRPPKTRHHLWMIPGCSSTVSSDTKCFNAELLFSSGSCQLCYMN